MFEEIYIKSFQERSSVRLRVAEVGIVVRDPVRNSVLTGARAAEPTWRAKATVGRAR
jgi:hypothetical protein